MAAACFAELTTPLGYVRYLVLSRVYFCLCLETRLNPNKFVLCRAELRFNCR